MANNYFKFKEFIVYQDKCSMKVCTDACILGAWAADMILTKQLKAVKCLDIGTGTGLLSLMLTQKTKAFVDAVEIDESSFSQAEDNFRNSPWHERLRVCHADAKYYCPGTKYDFIICNPPFYEHDLLSKQKNKNLAKHHEGLTFEGLIITITKNLHPSGSFALLLPVHRLDYFEKIAAGSNFFLQEKLLLKPSPGHRHFRGIVLFRKIKSLPVTRELVIKNNASYSAEFAALMKEYYLDL